MTRALEETLRHQSIYLGAPKLYLCFSIVKVALKQDYSSLAFINSLLRPSLWCSDCVWPIEPFSSADGSRAKETLSSVSISPHPISGLHAVLKIGILLEMV